MTIITISFRSLILEIPPKKNAKPPFDTIPRIPFSFEKRGNEKCNQTQKSGKMNLTSS